MSVIIRELNGCNATSSLALTKVDVDILEDDLSKLNVISGPNYYDAFNNELDHYQINLEDFLSTNGKSNSHFGEICAEHPLPDASAEKIALYFKGKAKTDTPPYSILHAGLKGAIAPLHFDWDFSWVLNVGISGRKKFFFIPPQKGWMLNPVLNTSTYCLPRFSEADQDEFLSKFEGQTATIEAGQGVLFPSCWWHGVLYESASTSISIRFGGSPYLRPLATLPRSHWLQRLAWKLWALGDTQSTIKAVQSCVESFVSCEGEGSWYDNYTRMNDLYRNLLVEFGDTIGISYTTPPNFNIELNLSKRELINIYTLDNVKPNDDVDKKALVIDYVFGQNFPTVNETTKAVIVDRALHFKQGLMPMKGLIHNLNFEDDRQIQ